MAQTPIDAHFVQTHDLDLFGHRPHKSAALLFNALMATAIWQTWPTLLFMGGWSAMVVLVNKNTAADLSIPSTMITVLGVLLGLTLSYRTSSAYDRYWEGRRMWSQIILASRTWARMVWIHCPDTLSATAITDSHEQALDEARAIIEKKTIVQLALAFSASVKHYLRGEEGILYEDLFDLVRYIPSLNLPSGIASAADAYNTSLPHSSSVHRPSISSSRTPYASEAEKSRASIYPPLRPSLAPARDPPTFRWSECFPVKFFVSRKQRMKAEGRKARKNIMKTQRVGGGVGQNVPLEVTMFMSSWIAAMQRRKTIDVPTTNTLIAALAQMSDALSALERILTTPIPFAYNAHIWEVTWVYCLVLPFQLYGAGFNWVTVPAVVITSYIVFGFAAIGEEIENPFGYDKNDLNLDFFVESIIKQELAAITARPFPPPEQWVFSPENKLFGIDDVGADRLQHTGLASIRAGLAALSTGRGRPSLRRARTPAASETEMV
ncbi:ion channel-forming bestrophin family protein, partial [Tremellales sp. Uapishka_1]